MEILSLFNILCFDLKITNLDLSAFKESLLAFNKSDVNFRSQSILRWLVIESLEQILSHWCAA